MTPPAPPPTPPPAPGHDDNPDRAAWSAGTLLLCAAMQPEARLLIPRLQAGPPLGRKKTWLGSLGGRPVILLLTGMGLVNAAQAATAALETLLHISAIISLGCAGAYAKAGLQTGQAVLADEAVLADSGVRTRERLHGLQKINIPLGHDAQGDPLFNRMPVDKDLSRAMELHNPGIRRGAFASVNQVSGDMQTARQVEQRWGCVLEEMESAALAQIAAWYGVAFAALRGVSNQAGDRSLDVGAGADAAQKALLNWLEVS